MIIASENDEDRRVDGDLSIANDGDNDCFLSSTATGAGKQIEVANVTKDAQF